MMKRKAEGSGGEILLFAGTTEGRNLSECLAASGIEHTLCVATEYGEIVLREHPLVRVRRGRMDREEIRELIVSGSFGAVVDATHPYAEAVTENINSAMRGLRIPYLRLKREQADEIAGGNVRYFDTNEACARALEETEGNILLTTGSKELSAYCGLESVRKRLFVRVLPGPESISACMEHGIVGKQIIAMQGPFTGEMNEALIRQYQVSCLVTKQSGILGGYPQKLEAAKNAGIPVFVIGHLKEEEGYSYAEICAELKKICGKNVRTNGKLQIILAGIGMGGKDSLTKEVRETIAQADILLGAERMIKPYQPRLEKRPFYLAEQIIPYLREVQEKNLFEKSVRAVILFSGDTGFYSGCQSVYDALTGAVRTGELRASVRVMPGISSVSYLAARIGESYHDAAVYSIHGKKLPNLTRRLASEPRSFLLMSGVEDVNRLGTALLKAGLTECEVVAGYQLSYKDEEIMRLDPRECAALKKEGLYTCFVRNRGAVRRRLTHGISDGEFIRDQVPMTKEEVREVSICKLRLRRGAVVYDIGSGTGSVAVEIAGLSDDIQVYAVEQRGEAACLIRKNSAKFGLENVSVVEAKAPEGLAGLPRATHAFLGGTGGNLKAILDALYQINPNMRVVMNAVTLETLCEMKEALSLYPTENEEIVQIQASRAKSAGQYHLMQAENPVWICAFDLRGH